MFPNKDSSRDFLWGTATSSYQIEGDCKYSDWDAFGKAGQVEGGAQCGKATDHWARRDSDLKLISDLGLNSYRFSLEWSKIEPEPGQFSIEAIQWYVDLVKKCKAKGIVPFLTLHHFSLPKWFADRGGFSNSGSVESFLRYLDFVLEHLGPHVKYWCTINEPMVLVVGQYLGQFMPPKVYSPRLASKALYHLLKIHTLSYEKIHEHFAKEKGEHPQVGYAHNLIRFLPDRNWHPLDFILSKVFSRFYNKAWVNSTLGLNQKFSVPFVLDYSEQVQEALGKVSMDYIGVNYYTKAYTHWRPRDSGKNQSLQLPIEVAFARKNEVQSDVGWSHYPHGLFEILKQLGATKLPIYITEHGVADQTDCLRAKSIREHLLAIVQANQQGCDVRGYFHWSLLDNFEWIKGFGPRFGLFEVDYDSYQRIERPSAQYYARIVQRHQGCLKPDPDLINSEKTA